MRTRIYIDGVPSWSENVPSRARVPWSAQGSIAGRIAAPSRTKPEPDLRQSHARGVETRRKLRGQGLEP